MPLVISLRTKTTIPCEVDSIQIEQVREQTADTVKSTLIQYGNKQVELGEFFDVSGSAEDDEIVWEGDCSHVKLIGTKMACGKIRIEGNAGMHLGAEMTGGEIVVNGNAADWVGAELHGGRIHVHGNAGHLIGAGYRGARRGMTGGEIFIDGNVGNEIGHTMRRGLIAIGGNTGDAVGFGMIAGTILVFGETGLRPGAGMKRGTIGLFSTTAKPELLPTFQYSCCYRPEFLALYLQELKAAGFPVPNECFSLEYLKFNGDFLETGKGEILLPKTAA